MHNQPERVGLWGDGEMGCECEPKIPASSLYEKYDELCLMHT